VEAWEPTVKLRQNQVYKPLKHNDNLKIIQDLTARAVLHIYTAICLHRLGGGSMAAPTGVSRNFAGSPPFARGHTWKSRNPL
jgi:hypothetical protein